jgi:hypothetical protein
VARKVVADAAKAKAEKQKKMVIVLGIVLALAMAFAVHTMMSLNKAPSASSLPQAADPSATTVATTTPAATGTTPALPAAPTLSGAGTPTATTSTSSTQLVAAVTPPAGTGQLQSFSLFESKDPFHAKGPGTSSTSSTSSTPSSPNPSGGSSSGAPKTPPAPPTPPPSSAVISVNGAAESVASGGNFPASNPLFQLLSLTTKTAKISVVGGSYASGAATLTLTVNKAVTLVNTADGTRYTIELMPQGTVPPAAAPSSDGTTTTATTTTSSGG